MSKTPYAVLLAKPTDSDETVRKLYHRIAEANHPDRSTKRGAPGPLWFDATEAYTAIKTREKRYEWRKHHETLSGLCQDCEGYGVRGARLFKGTVRPCPACGGEGRTA